ncbi:MAG: CAAX protease [Bacteroidetes bacterium GWA2_40_15]|nr:MAG: CAAX protease [Bacteroidetes bacterium GWA2_40_15]
MLRLFWQNKIKFNWVFGLILILLFGIPRFIIVLNANVIGNYGYISIIFLLMWITPWIFLTKEGRSYIGIRKPTNSRWLLYSFLGGAAFCVIVFIVGILIFNHSYSNWFVYISKSYQSIGIISTASQRLTYFLIYSLVGMTFSPIGEELFYRGIVHGSFVKELGEQKASIIDSLAFALTHLAHFGIIYMFGDWHFLFIPAILWVIFMFITSRIFFICKQKTGSIYGAIISHAAFNLTMMYLIFYHILK